MKHTLHTFRHTHTAASAVTENWLEWAAGTTAVAAVAELTVRESEGERERKGREGRGRVDKYTQSSQRGRRRRRRAAEQRRRGRNWKEGRQTINGEPRCNIEKIEEERDIEEYREGGRGGRVVCHTSVAACDSDSQQEKKHLLWLVTLK